MEGRNGEADLANTSVKAIGRVLGGKHHRRYNYKTLSQQSLSRWSGLKKKKKNTHTSRALFFSFWGLEMFTTKCVVMESNSASINNDVFTGENKKIRKKSDQPERREESLTFCEFVFGGRGVNGTST